MLSSCQRPLARLISNKAARLEQLLPYAKTRVAISCNPRKYMLIFPRNSKVGRRKDAVGARLNHLREKGRRRLPLTAIERVV